jgi:hypothetical protein
MAWQTAGVEPIFGPFDADALVLQDPEHIRDSHTQRLYTPR